MWSFAVFFWPFSPLWFCWWPSWYPSILSLGHHGGNIFLQCPIQFPSSPTTGKQIHNHPNSELKCHPIYVCMCVCVRVQQYPCDLLLHHGLESPLLLNIQVKVFRLVLTVTYHLLDLTSQEIQCRNHTLCGAVIIFFKYHVMLYLLYSIYHKVFSF